MTAAGFDRRQRGHDQSADAPRRPGWCLGWRRHAHYVEELHELRPGADLCATCLLAARRDEAR